MYCFNFIIKIQQLNQKKNINLILRHFKNFIFLFIKYFHQLFKHLKVN
jgi:hypothetical protein